MKKGKGLLRITSICICAVLLMGAVPSSSRAEIVQRAANAAVAADNPAARDGAALKTAEGGPAPNGSVLSAEADQAAALMQMRAGDEDDEKKPSYYWTTFYVIGGAILIMVLLGST